MLPIPPQHSGRVRIAPVSSAMITQRPRDPRLLKGRAQPENTAINHQHPAPVLTPIDILGSISTKSLPRIPKYSNSGSGANSTKRDHDERDPRKRRDRDRDESKNKSESREKSKSSSKSSSSSERNSKKSSESPRKRSDDDKKSSKSSSSHHKSSRSHSSKSSSSHKSSSSSGAIAETKPIEDVDLRILPPMNVDTDMRQPHQQQQQQMQDSTTNDKLNKNKLLNDLLHDEDLKTSQDMMITTSNDNGKQYKPILTVMINLNIIYCDRHVIA